MNLIKKTGWSIMLITSFLLFVIGFYDTEKNAVFWSISLLMAVLVEKYGYSLLYHKFDQRMVERIVAKRRNQL